MRRSHIYTIPAHKPFVDVLAAYVLREYGADPLTLSQLLILLPSRRACRSLREAFLRISNGKPLLLPRMQPIGDVDEDELLLTSFLDESTAAELAELPPVISSSRRLMLLTRLVWQAQKTAHRNNNIEQAMHLAQELMRLLDEVTREQLSFDKLTEIVPEDFADHWQLTLDFLRILTEHWPKLLREEGVEEPIARRNKLLELLTAQWRKQPPAFPVIAAGSTGSIPATAELLKAIAFMPQGKVILPGLDISMTEEILENLAHSHPQFGMVQLLERMGCRLEEVDILDIENIPGASLARFHLLNQALLPAEATQYWQKPIADIEEGLAGLHVITAASLREEAQIITLILRTVLEEEGRTAALVTHDRDLARRVAAELKRYNIDVDDSAGISLSSTPAGTYLCLLADMIASRAAPVPLLALLKHPFSGGGMALPVFRDAVREIERAFLRGIRMETGIEALLKAARQHPTLSANAREAIEYVVNVCTPLLVLMDKDTVSLEHMLSAHLTCAEKLADTDTVPGKQRLWEKDSGESLAGFISELQQAAPLMGSITPSYYSGMFALSLSSVTWRPKYGKHPRLQILSPLEARMQHYDVMVLGGLNDGIWPPAAHTDAWMNRSMRADFGLPAPERALGQAAHDFSTLAAAPVCYLTRASKIQGAPTEPSPWLLRLRALLEGQGKADMFANAENTLWHHWVRVLNASENRSVLMPPEPRPPVTARPKSFSVTQIEKLMRDPYALYAQKILDLRSLDPIDADPDMAEFGNAIHNALEAFVRQHPVTLPEDPLQELLQFGRVAFAHILNRPAVQSFWWPRFERIATWFIAQEKERRKKTQQVHTESRGVMQIQAGEESYTLSAKIDRIEQYGANSFIIDYKTGAIPSKEDVRLGYACQLPLEALIATKGTIEGIEGPLQVAGLEYWKLSGSHEKSEVCEATGRKLDLPGLVEEAKKGVVNLLSAYGSEKQAYYSCPDEEKKPRYSDYDHLARITEWE